MEGVSVMRGERTQPWPPEEGMERYVSGSAQEDMENTEIFRRDTALVLDHGMADSEHPDFAQPGAVIMSKNPEIVWRISKGDSSS